MEKPSYKLRLPEDFIPYSTRYAQRNPERNSEGELTDKLNQIMLRKFGLRCYNGVCTAVVFGGAVLGLAKILGEI